MRETCQKKIGLFGVTATSVEGVLRTADLKQTAWELAGNLAVCVTVTAEGDTPAEANERADAVTALLNEAFPDAVYTDKYGSLWNTVSALFREKKRTFALAEGCTGGMIAKTITDLPDTDGIFPLGVVQSGTETVRKLLHVKENTIEEYGAISEEAAAEMAEGVRSLAGTDFGIGVAGAASPGETDERYPCGTVFVALSDGEHAYVRHLSLTHSDRTGVRCTATLHALDMLRPPFPPRATPPNCKSCPTPTAGR